ncbi:DUF2188 domain-containing protein [Mesobaculum littorinae]|uniref:DUF2188 domain-containing protein n=1 Tax=Mesobaculum littorinae TaxID=2486419 RepID=A0A438AHD8_9RHOB|nr:DUF2188 domain-containing protein [Mesobaculum littorinae]RVV98084.1 DUF2188 domain-containing protein [Mesobaculum littorinae]
MTDLPKYTLSPAPQSDAWVLRADDGNTEVARFDTKTDALAGGALEAALPDGRGSVKIQREDGVFEEERTYPRSADPRRSPG